MESVMQIILVFGMVSDGLRKKSSKHCPMKTTHLQKYQIMLPQFIDDTSQAASLCGESGGGQGDVYYRDQLK